LKAVPVPSLKGKEHGNAGHYGYAHSYESAERYVRVLKPQRQGVGILHCEPGEEGQVDFFRGVPTFDLLVIEDFGMKKLGAPAAEDLLEVFVRRHEAASHRHHHQPTYEDWATFLDVPATTAILDRFLSHLELVTMRGKSYRLHKNGSPFAKDNPE